MNKLDNNLNEMQKKAVETTEGPLLILAGAGAGKTKTIVERIRHLVRSGVNPSEILAITFTNKAAQEMRQRVEDGLRDDLSINRPVSIYERPFVSTFHSLGVHILREQSAKIGKTKRFVIFDRDDSKKAVRDALATLGLDPKAHDPGRIMSIISLEKGRGVSVRDYIEDEGTSYSKELIGQVWQEYDKELKRGDAFDFDDLLLETANLLRNEKEVREHYRNIWKYIHIDEYQDTSRVQYQISKLLVGERKNVCAVGDIDQNIYSWRGANIKNILDFEKDYPDAQVVLLEKNYRSTKTILSAANAVIEKNEIRREKNLFTDNSSGEKIVLFQGFNEADEAQFIASKTSEILKAGARPEDIAVLYRANFQSRVLEEAFMNLSIPYQLIGTKFFERKEVKDILSYLRAALNPGSLADLKRIINTPARGIGKTTVVKIFSGFESELPSATKTKLSHFRSLLKEFAEISKTKKPSETIEYIIKESGLEEEWKASGDDGAARLENAYELASFASKYDEFEPQIGVDKFLDDAALQSDQDEIKEEGGGVRLMTVHASKGLEFDTVFISGLEDGLFPHEKMNEAGITREEAEEERRLFYVALTRARKKVFLSFAQSRTLFGRRQVNMPSPFMFDIPEILVEWEAARDYEPRSRGLLDIEF